MSQELINNMSNDVGVAGSKMLEIAKQKMTRANFTNFETKVVNLPIGNLQYSTNFDNLEIFGYP